MTKHCASKQEKICRNRIGECSWVVPFLGPKYGDVYFQCLSQASPAGKTKHWFTRLWIGGPLSGKTHEVSCFYGDLEVLVLWFYGSMVILWKTTESTFILDFETNLKQSLHPKHDLVCLSWFCWGCYAGSPRSKLPFIPRFNKWWLLPYGRAW
jgi:hypothetical protein